VTQFTYTVAEFRDKFNWFATHWTVPSLTIPSTLQITNSCLTSTKQKQLGTQGMQEFFFFFKWKPLEVLEALRGLLTLNSYDKVN